MVILPEVALAGTIPVAERIRKAVETARFPNEDLRITISGGAAEYSGSIEQLVKQADSLMYRAKANGRNIIQY
jgi:diguanylate cyclase (GGDEF)-like protein